jgi:aryl sulfotransferase
MQESTSAWPQKTQEIQDVILDSTRWNGFAFRDGDIVIATYGKTGTTWTQQIVGQLIFRGAEGLPVMDICPWVDMRFGPPLPVIRDMLEAQTHRRFMKTHLPLEALVFSPRAKYIYIARDGRDVVWSMYNHIAGFTKEAHEMINSTPGRSDPPLGPLPDDVVQFFRGWLRPVDQPVQRFWPHNQGWWNAWHLPNVLLVHFNNLKTDLPAEMRRIAAFLDIDVEEALWPTLVEHCTFDYMKENSSRLSSFLDVMFQGGAKTFIHKGTNGRWRDLLSAEDIEAYERAAKENLTPDCAHWLATGKM